MKKILILGAGIYQVPLILRAKQRGFYTIVTSIPGSYPGFNISDKAYYADTTDSEAILNIAFTENIDGIVTCGTDVAVRSIGVVCEKLGLPGITSTSAMLSTDKALMKKAFLDSNVRTAPFYCVHNIKEAINSCNNLGLPVVFKCVDRSGSKGIQKVFTKSQINSAFKYAFSVTRSDYILIEKLLSGKEYGCDGYVSATGKLFAIPHGRLSVSNGLTDIPVGHYLPLECDSEVLSDIIKQVSFGVNALGLRQSFFNADIMICNRNAYIIEMGARCGATCIPELISSYYGYNYYDKILDAALGVEPDFTPYHKRPSAAKLLFSEKSGIVKTIYKENMDSFGITDWSFDISPGDSVKKFMSGTDRIGQVVSAANCVEDAVNAVDAASKCINIEFV